MKIQLRLFIFFLLGMSLAFSACIKSDEEEFIDPFEQLAKDEATIKKYIADNSIPAIRDTSGVYYQIISPGTGNFQYVASTQISVNYKGKLLNGNIFDETTGTPRIFTLGGNLISGWKIGIPKIQKGGKIRLLIPSGYAYGNSSPSNDVPPNSILDFDVELVDVK